MGWTTRRAGIWAFGRAAFEMPAGDKAFKGETVTETLANILEGRLKWQPLPADASGEAKESPPRRPKLSAAASG